ncbi:hypothetical protein [Fulvivirga sediminis]|nr:hypothetical protein [Fulvivirga sediminis]
MKRYLLLCLPLAACSSVKIERPEIKGTIYDSVSKAPIEEVLFS